MRQLFLNLVARLRRNPVAAAGRMLERAQADHESARETVMARAERERVRGMKLKERAAARFSSAADHVENAERASRVAARIREILS